MNILVTGSLGVIGSRVVPELRSRGHRVVGLDLRHDADVDHVRADIRHFRQLERAFDAAHPEVVLHLAAEFGRLNGEGWYEDVWSTNVIGTRHVVEICKAWEVPLVFASSSEVYGDSYEDDLVLKESMTDDRAPRQQNDYAISKWVNEEQIARLMPEATVLRFFNSYGPGEYYTPYRSVVSLFAYRLLKGRSIRVYEGYERAFMYMTDFIPTLANAVERNPSGVFNIGGGEVRKVEEVAHMIADITGADQRLIELASFEEHNTRAKRPDNTKAREALGHDPRIPLEVGVPATVTFMKKEYGL